METYNHLLVLYSLLIEKEQYYDSNNYKWVLGSAVINDLNAISKILFSPYEKIALFNIEVERDIYNPQRISIYKDITDQLRGCIL